MMGTFIYGNHFTTQQVPAVALGILKEGLSWGQILGIQMRLIPSI